MNVTEISPVRIRPGKRPQVLRWAVVDGDHVVAVFVHANQATAYCKRLERIRRDMGVTA